jgi:pantothenate kinase-related protein Tda10
MFRRKQNPNEPLHMFIIGGVGIGKNFMLMLLIQSLVHFYNKHLELDLFKKKALLMTYIEKITFNIDETIIHSSLSIPLNDKYFPSLSLLLIYILIKKYDQL